MSSLEIQTKIVKKIPNFSTKYPVIVDIESKGAYVEIRTLQVYQPQHNSKTVYILDYDEVGEEIFNEAKKLERYELIAHRSIFDFGFIDIIPKKAHDTLMLARIAYPELANQGGYALDIVAKFMFKDYYKEYNLEKKSIRTSFKRGKPLTKDQLNYASLDCIVTAKIFKKLKKYTKTKVYKLNEKMLRYSLQIARNGLLVDIQLAKKELSALKADIEANYKILDGVNPRSAPQVLKALGKPTNITRVENVVRTVQGKKIKKDIEFPVYKYKKFEFVRADKSVLLHLIGMGHTIAKAVYDQRRLLKAQNMLETYISNPINDKVAKCVSYLYPMGTYTNRYSGSGGDLDYGINAQQITRKYQYLFHQPYNGTVVVHADYSTAEVRLASMVMEEKTLAKILRDGVDVHKYTASIILDKSLEKITKEERQQAKAVVFGFLFGMSANTFQDYAYTNYGVVFTLEEAQEVRNKFFKAYPALQEYHKRIWNEYKNTYQTSPLGLKGKPKLGTDAINYPVQAGIGETTKLAEAILVKKYPQALNYVFNIVHDAIYMRVPEKEAEKWSKRLAKAMKKAWDKLQDLDVGVLKLSDIPMPVEVEYIDSKDKTHIKEV